MRRAVRLAAGALTLASVLWVGWLLFRDGARHADPPRQLPGTRRMAQRLLELPAKMRPETNIFLSARRVEHFEKLLKKPSKDLAERMHLRMQLAEERLNAGYSEEAIADLDAMMAELESLSTQQSGSDGGISPEAFDLVRKALAIACFRLGEQENCIRGHGVESCILPLRGSGLHVAKTGAQRAKQEYLKLLREHPDDLEARWLLTIACMALDEYPNPALSELLIPPETFASDYEIKRFRDIAPAVGLDHIGLAGGCVVEDLTGNGLMDVLTTSWGLDETLQCFWSDGSGRFVAATEQAGLTGIVGGANVVHADYDDDGTIDVFILRGGWLEKDGHHPNSLLRNNGDGTFEDVTDEAGLLAFHPTQTAAWADYDNDGDLDVFVGNETLPSDPHACELFDNRGDGTFTECAALRNIRTPVQVKGVAWGDYDNDGLPDLYQSSAQGSNALYHNDGSRQRENPTTGEATSAPPLKPWRFTDVSRQAGVIDPFYSFPTWFWDYDNDGWQDILVFGYGWHYLRNVVADYMRLPHGGELPRLYRNNRDGTFADVTKSARLDTMILAMGCNFGDLDNDGFPDFYAGTGEPSVKCLIPNRMFRNSGSGFFQEVTTSGGFGHLQKGHGVAFVDLDNDGDQDVFAVMGGAYSGDVFQNVLFENPGHGNRWITLTLHGTRSNRSSIGARIRVRVETTEGTRDIHATVGTGGSFGSQSLRQEIGLGLAQSIEFLEIRWPATGEVQIFRDPPMDRILLIREGADRFVPVDIAKVPFDAAADHPDAASQHDHSKHRHH